jgi:hypothetical protein
MKSTVLAVVVAAAAAVVSGIMFVIALFHQFALVEVAASLLTGLQVFFLSSSIGDLLEEQTKANKARQFAVLSTTAGLLVFYALTAHFH